MIEAVLTVLGIVVPALLLVLLLRRWEFAVPWPVAGVLLLIVFVYLGHGLAPGSLPVPVDEVMRGYPYRGVVGDVQPKNPLTNDTVKQILPWMHAVKQELRQLRLPLWNPYAFSGSPLLGNGQSAPFSPFFLATLFVPLPKQLVAMAGLKIFVSLLFSFLVLRREGISAAASVFGATVISCAVFQTVYLYYPLTSVSSLLPAAIFAMQCCLDQADSRSSILVALVVASGLAGGHPESVVHIAIIALLFLMIELLAPIRPRSRGAVRALLAGLAAGVLLAAPAWLPVLEQVRLSTRFAEIHAGRSMTSSFPGIAAYAFLNPDAFGNPARQTWSWIYNYSIVAPTYFGLLPLALLVPALFSTRATRRDRYLVIGALLLFLIAFNWTFAGHALNSLPVLSVVANDRLRFGAVFLIAVAAARIIDRWREHWRLALVGCSVAGVLATVFYVTRLEAALPLSGLLAVGGLGLVCLAAVLSWPGPKPRAVAWTACAVMAVELSLGNFVFNAPAPQRFYIPTVPLIEYLRKVAPKDPFRMVGFDWAFAPNASVQYQIEDVRGSDPMATAAYVRFLDLVATFDAPYGLHLVKDANSAGLRFLNVRYLMAEPGFVPGGTWKEIYRGADGGLFLQTDGLPRFYAPTFGEAPVDPLLEQLSSIRNFGDRVVVEGLGRVFVNPQPRVQVVIHQQRPTRFILSVDATAATLVASSQPWSPGWKVVIDGRSIPIRTINGAFIGFVVPAGKHEVHVSYAPGWLVPAMLSFATALAALSYLLWRSIRIKSRHRAELPSPEGPPPTVSL
jgi:Bacterial membrane protein YfhO